MVRLVLAVSLGGAAAQQKGDNDDFHLPLPIKHCTKSGCKTEHTTVTLDANWRWMHDVDGYHNCFGESGWNRDFCPDAKTCSRKCALEGISEDQWTSTYGVSKVENGVKLKYIPGSRIYLMDSQHTYKMFSLKNKEFAVDVDMSEVPCGVNGAVYFSEMEQDGGMASSKGLNTAGAEYGSGYCDAQCPRDIHFIGGYANVDGDYGSCCAEFDVWEANKEAMAYTAHPCKLEGPKRQKCSASRRRSAPSPSPSPGGAGCCSWAPNDACGETTDYCKGSASNCKDCGGHWVPKKTAGCCSWAGPGQNQACGETTEYCAGNAEQCQTCGGHWVNGLELNSTLADEMEEMEEMEELELESGLPPCDGGRCDQPGCDFNAYREGARDFFGPGGHYTLDSSKPFTVITQFLTSGGSQYGDLVEVRRSYVQNGKTIGNPSSSFVGLSQFDSLKDDTCAEQKHFFNRSGTNEFKNNGGMRKMGEALGRGMVLALSIWDDGAAKMQWLDGWEPEDKTNPEGPGALRGPCPRDSGEPSETRRANPDAYVVYSNIRYGDIGQTHKTSTSRRRRRRSHADAAEVVV